MTAIKIILVAIAITTAVTLLLVANISDNSRASLPVKHSAGKRVSRFLQQKERNPRAADHCHKDHEVCNYIMEGRNTTCCNNKCLDLQNDNKNCGACKNKCRFSDTCCNGECVNLAYDKRHCGSCGNKCMTGGFCIYGMCDYA